MAAKIMIVDDEFGIRDTVSRYLTRHGLDVVTACDGNECIRNIMGGFTGIVILDIYMPDLNGWETIREIIKRGFIERILIIMLTAASSIDEKEEELKEYVLDYIPKPADLKELAEAIKNYLQYFDDEKKSDK